MIVKFAIDELTLVKFTIDELTLDKLTIYIWVGYNQVCHRWIGFRWVGFRWVGFRRVGFRWVDFRWADSSQVDFRHVELRQAGLRWACLRSIDMLPPTQEWSTHLWIMTRKSFIFLTPRSATATWPEVWVTTAARSVASAPASPTLLGASAPGASLGSSVTLVSEL